VPACFCAYIFSKEGHRGTLKQAKPASFTTEQQKPGNTTQASAPLVGELNDAGLALPPRREKCELGQT
jgi:hypothetical protein